MVNVTGKLGQRGTASMLAIAIVATLGTGTAAAMTRGGSVAGIAAAQHTDPVVAQRAYLAKLAPVANRIYLAVSPAQHVLNAIDTPHAGDAFAARDALANGESLVRLTAAQRSLMRLAAPTGLTAQRHQLLTTTRGMIAALKALRSLRNDSDGRHLMSRVTKLGARLTVAAGNFDTAVDVTYQVVNRAEPKGFSIYRKAPVTQTSWIFGADRSCSAAEFTLSDLIKYRTVSSVSDAEALDRLWAHGLAVASHRIRAVPTPHGPARLPRTLSSRLRVLKYNSRLFAKLRSGLQHQSLSTVSAASDQIHSLQPSLRTLGKDLRSYGAVSCGQIIGIWGGNKHLLTVVSQHHRTLST